MQNIFNFRALAVLGLSLVLGGYFFAYLFFNEISKIVLSFVVILILFFLFYFSVVKKIINIKKVIGCVIIPFIVGAFVVFIVLNGIVNNTPKNCANCFVSGDVVKITQRDDGGYYIYLDDVSACSGEDLYNLSGITRVSVSKARYKSEIKLGDKIEVNGDFSSFYKTDSDKNYFNAKNGYSGKVTAKSYNVTKGSGIKYSLTNAAKDVIEENMDSDLSGVAYAMLFGDKCEIDSDLSKNFSASGLAHILAVSGLHVGFIISLFGFILSLVIKNKNYRSLMLCLIIVFYAYLCSFSASVVRASVMAIILVLSNIMGKQYDGINALSFSCLVNFVLNPLCIFSLSFLLSYTVVFSIFALSPPLTAVLSKRVPKNIASIIAVSLSAWIGSIALLMFGMSSFSFYSIVVNILVVPFVGIIFMCLSVVLMLSIIPFFRFLFVVPNFLYRILTVVVKSVGSLRYASITLTCGLMEVVMCIVATFIASDYIFHKKKYLISCIFATLFFVLTMLKVVI